MSNPQRFVAYPLPTIGQYAVVDHDCTDPTSAIMLDRVGAAEAERVAGLLNAGKIKLRSGYIQATRTAPARPVNTFDAYTSAGPVCCKDLAEALTLV